MKHFKIKVMSKLFMYFQMLFLVILMVGASASEFVRSPLHQNWQLKVLGGPAETANLKSKIYNTSIPTVLHLDLLRSNDIPDPFLKDNYPKLRWVSECQVLYSTTFQLQQKIFDLDVHQLVFEGIDTYSDITLNGQSILSTENAFRKYVKNVNGVLKVGANLLEVRINSTKDRDDASQRANNMPFVYAHTRKACYQYSWDWAPYLNTMGIWKQVYLESFQQAKLDYVWVRTRFISKPQAIINFAVALDIQNKESLTDKYKCKVFLNKTELKEFQINDKYNYQDIHIANPQLWWPNGIGKPYIYDFTVIFYRGDAEVDRRNIAFGIRTVELDRTSNKFTVKVNGYAIYCKGANYVPPDMFYPRLENPQYTPGNTIENLLNDAVQSHFNMIRLWGGGQYQSDQFFQLASRKGIMIFYDFMFSDSIYPSSEAFLINTEEEIKQQIRRVRNYPCLTLWSGNNQILQGINDWGWGRQNYKDDYHKLFEILIPKIIEYESSYIPYIASSPVLGVGNYGFERGGDVHFWGVWAGGSEFEAYRGAIGPFNSEFGTQALPVWETICQVVDEKDRNYNSQVLLTHERHNSQFGTLRNYMRLYMKQSQNFQLETYQSGLLQAFAVEIAIKAQRISKPKSFGTLYWQFNDAWPAISWSSIDYFGRWKPLQYMAKRLYPDVAIYTQLGKVYAINDKLYQVEALAVLKIYSFTGETLHSEEMKVKLQANQVKLLWTLSQEHYKNTPQNSLVIYTEIVAGKNEIMSSTDFLVRFKDLNLPNAELVVEYHEEFDEITVSSSQFIKNLHIYNTNQYLKLSNNYFDLIPGIPVKVLLKEGKLSALRKTMKFRGYQQVYTNQDMKISEK